MNMLKYLMSVAILGWYIHAQSEGRTFMGSSYKNRNRTAGFVNHK